MNLSYHAALMLSKLQQKYPSSPFTINDMLKSVFGLMDTMKKKQSVNELLSTFFIEQTGSAYSEKTLQKTYDMFELSEAGKQFVIKMEK